MKAKLNTKFCQGMLLDRRDDYCFNFIPIPFCPGINKAIMVDDLYTTYWVHSQPDYDGWENLTTYKRQIWVTVKNETPILFCPLCWSIKGLSSKLWYWSNFKPLLSKVDRCYACHSNSSKQQTNYLWLWRYSLHKGSATLVSLVAYWAIENAKNFDSFLSEKDVESTHKMVGKTMDGIIDDRHVKDNVQRS